MKDFNKYTFTCPECGKTTDIKSNQPAGGCEPFICSCYYSACLILQDNVKGKHLYNVRPDTLQLQKDIVSVIEDIKESMTVRQIYYRLVASGHPKTEEFYSKSQRALLDMRERGLLPYGLIADNTRAFYKARTFNNLETCLTEAQQYYRKDFWETQDTYVEIWLEKEALRAVFNDVTYEMQIPLYVTKGFSSISFMYAAAEEIKLIEKPVYIYLFSDYDPSGIMVYNSFKKRMREFGVKAQFIRPCLTPDQIEDYNVIMRPTKQSNHSKEFIGDSAELDALHPRILKDIVRSCIEPHINQEEYQKLKNIELAEKETLKKITNNLR